MGRTGSDTIEDALELLDKAATQDKDKLLDVMSDNYKHLKTFLAEKEGGLGKSLSDAKVHAIEAAEHAKEVGVEKVRTIAHDVDKNIRNKPWPYIAGAASVSLLLGYCLGRNRK